ncbi:PrsW family intramembrane metalloprotease [bacterium]|nr:MAG: PrsW family intramembrane metalloprotease [bacterium]
MLENVWLLTALALAPGLAITIYMYRADKYEKEPKRLLLACFIGGMISIGPAIFFGDMFQSLGFSDNHTSISTLLYAFITVALSEEFSKYVFFKRIGYNNENFNEPFDGIIYSVMVAMGFATLENLLYVYQMGFTVAIMRMFTAVPAHATFGVLIGYFAGVAKFKSKVKSKFYLILGVLLAVLFHGAYDYFLMERNYEWMFVGAMFSLYAAIYLSGKAIKSHQMASPFR